MQLPPCGLYRTRVAIANIPARRLVFFHNHGDPGPGLYLPSGWTKNRAQWQAQGTTLSDPTLVSQLEPLLPEGLYRVTDGFHCCEKQCRRFEAEMLVQLGYNGEAQPILFVPELIDGLLAIPERGTPIDDAALGKLKQLKVPTVAAQHGGHVH